VTITGKMIRAAGKGLIRVDETKTAAGRRTLPLPSFAVTVLSARRSLPYLGEQTMVFPSTAGTWRDPDNFRARWRAVRDALGVPDVTSHSFRKTVATLIDDAGLSARIGADHLGTPGCRRPRTPTWPGVGRTTLSPSCWKGPFAMNKRWIPARLSAKWPLTCPRQDSNLRHRL
jgi:hypothetical protein